MSAENKAIIRQYIERLWAGGDISAVDQYISPNFVGRTAGMPIAEGREGFKQMLLQVQNAFSDQNYDLQDIIGEDDKVVVRWAWQGTHVGEMMGMPATGKRVGMTGTVTFQLANGMIEEWWENIDFLSMLQQLGAIPAPEQAQA